MRKLSIAILALLLISCGTMTKNSMTLEPGMSKHDVIQVLGVPDGRSFRGEDEALQYQEIAGYGQCSYITVWLSKSKLLAVTNRNGASIAGCGLGSKEVDWGQMPRNRIDVNISTNK